MSKWLLALCAAMLGGALVVTDVDAKRLGGSRSIGVQRNVTNAPPASTPARPAQQQAAPAQQAPAAQNAPAPSGMSRWLPMLGGLAIGGLLGSMFGGGLGGGLGGVLLMVLLAIGAVLAFRAFGRRREEGAPQRMQYAGMGSETVAAPPQLQSSNLEGKTPATPVSNVPVDFDAAGFLRAAKLNFVKLQVANDAGKLDEIRELTTSEMFEELRRDVAERAHDSRQQTDVVTLEADLLEVATESDKHWASVRFSGMVRETPGTAPVDFAEVWNLVKPTNGSSGWLLAGVQQMQ